MPNESASPASADPSVPPQRCLRLRHDLRTFVNNISGYGELIIQDAAERDLTPLVDELQELQRASRLIVEMMSGFIWDPLVDGGAAYYQPIESELLAFAAATLQHVDRAHAHAATDGNGGDEGLRSDLARIERAATGLQELAATIVRTATAAGEGGGPVSQAVLPVAVSAALAPAASSERPPIAGTVLVIDDNDSGRDLLCRLLAREGLEVSQADGGKRGLESARSRRCDLILLDLLMSDMDGLSVLRRLKSDPALARIPVVMLSAIDELPSVVSCLEAGAEDYISKPFDPMLLRSRVKVLIERKHFQDEERRRTAQLEAALAGVESQQRVSEELLANILPASVARDLREHGHADPLYFEDVTIVITDFVGFTVSTERLSADELVEVLNTYFTAFDRIADRYGVEKLRTMGDSYMFASGLPERTASHPVDAVLAALEMVEVVKQLQGHPVDWTMRVGIHTGPVIAGIVGIRKFSFDVWGDTVNLTARMESAGVPNRLNLSERTYARVKDFFTCEHRGRISIKEGRELDMYFADGITPKLVSGATSSPPPAFARRYTTYFQKSLKAFPEQFLS